MAKKLTEASLRKKLKQMDEVSLIQMIIDLYKGFAGFGWEMEDYISGEYYSIPWIGEG